MSDEKKSLTDEKKISKTVEFKEKGAVMEKIKGHGSAKVVMENIKESDSMQEVPAKFKDLVKQIEELSVLDLSELVKVFEKKFGVSAAAPAMMAAMPAAGGADEAEAEEKSDFDVELVAAGDAKIAIIKIIREVTGKGLKDAKDMVDAAPKVIKEKAPKTEAEELKKKLEDAGATVKLK